MSKLFWYELKLTGTTLHNMGTVMLVVEALIYLVSRSVAQGWFTFVFNWFPLISLAAYCPQINVG